MRKSIPVTGKSVNDKRAYINNVNNKKRIIVSHRMYEILKKQINLSLYL